MNIRYGLVSGVALLVLFAAVPRTVSAAPIVIGDSQLWLYDGTTVGCSTCSASVWFELLTETTLKVSFENTSTDGEAGNKILTGVAFDTDPNLSGISLDSQSIEGGKVWKLGNIGGGTWELKTKAETGIGDGLDNELDSEDSGWVVLAWTSPIVGALGLNIDDSIVKFQAANAQDLSLQAPGNPVPEPGTLLLLGSGLVLAARRRWQKSRLPIA